MSFANDVIEDLVRAFAKLPGMGRRSARRMVLRLFSDRDRALNPLMELLNTARDQVQICTECGNLDVMPQCRVCQNIRRNQQQICVVEQISDLWAMERTGLYSGVYHVLDGVLSALDGIGPDDLHIGQLIKRVEAHNASGHQQIEIILATNLTLNGLTTAHYLAEQLQSYGCTITRLAHGIPAGGELEFMDDGTLAAALKMRASL